MSTNIAVGDVYLIYARQSNPPKLKRIILVAQVEGNSFLGVFINSQPNANVHSAETIRAFHPKLEADGRGYLEWDSYADCCYPYEYALSEIHTAMRRHPNAYLGNVSPADIACFKKHS